MHWENEHEDVHWFWERPNSGLLAFVERKHDRYICYLLSTVGDAPDTAFTTLKKAKAWCEAMCALAGAE